jgi:ribose transport system permease protein
MLLVMIFGIWDLYQAYELGKPLRFLTFLNLGNIISQTSVVAIAAVGMTFIIVSAGIDLSVGSLIALTGVYGAFIALWTAGKVPLFGLISLSIAAAALTGAVAGIITGTIITKGKLPPFIVTLGMLEIIRGTVYLSTGGLPISGLPTAFSWMGNDALRLPLGTTYPLVLPYSLILLIPTAVVAHFLLKYTVFGVQTYAIGSNEQTARLCGVNIDRMKIYVYMIGGITAGLAGFLQASRLRTGQPGTAVGMELDVIAAVVVGGGSLMGGEGTILGSIIGAFIIQILRNGCNIMGIEAFVQRLFIGMIIIAAVYVDQLRRKSLSAGRNG